jgi:hypothetical protein
METDSLKSFLLQLREFVTRSYEEDIAAIDRVLGIADEHSSPVPTDKTLPLPLKETPQHQEPQVDEALSLIDAVENIFRSDPHKGWNVKTLHRKLVASGFAFQSKNPKASINTALSRLLNKRMSILVIQHGSGRRPTQYKLVPFAKEQNSNGRVNDMR